MTPEDRRCFEFVPSPPSTGGDDLITTSPVDKQRVVTVAIFVPTTRWNMNCYYYTATIKREGDSGRGQNDKIGPPVGQDVSHLHVLRYRHVSGPKND